MAQVDYTMTEDKENNFDVIPNGEYIAHVKNSEIRQTKNGNDMLMLTWEILDGEFKGRLIFENLNLWHPKSQVKAIAQGAMNSICQATGNEQGIKDSSQLHNKAIIIKVVEKDDEVYGKMNIIKKHIPYVYGQIEEKKESKTENKTNSRMWT